MSEKTTLLSEAETEFTLFKRAIAGLDEARMRQVWLGTWSARDIVAHISGWHREMGPALERIARGERPVAEGVSYEDVDAWNGRFADAKKAARHRRHPGRARRLARRLHAGGRRGARGALRARQDRPQDRGSQQPPSLSGASRADRGLAQGRLVTPTRWGVLVVPALLYFLSYFHRVAPVVVAGDLMAAFAVSAATLGALSAIYPYCFAAMGLPGGSLADFLGRAPHAEPGRAQHERGLGALRAGARLRGGVRGAPARGPGRLRDPHRRAAPGLGVVRHRRVRHRRRARPRAWARSARSRAPRRSPCSSSRSAGAAASSSSARPPRCWPSRASSPCATGRSARAGARPRPARARAARDHRGDPGRARQSPLVDGGPHLGRHLRRLRRLRGPLGRAVSHPGLRPAARAGRQPGRAGRAWASWWARR